MKAIINWIFGFYAGKIVIEYLFNNNNLINNYSINYLNHIDES